MDYITAKEKAVKYIGISKKTVNEVVKKLEGLNVDSLVIVKVIKELEELGYLDDFEYTKLFIKQNLKQAKYSIYEIKHKLLQKGIKRYIIEEELNKLIKINYEKNIIDNLFKTKLKNYDEIKAKNYLFRRGFKGDTND